MDVKERIKQFIDFKQLSERKFSKKISPSETYFTSTKTIGSDKLEKIAENFPELNMDWVITGRGEMIIKEEQITDPLPVAAEHQAEYKTKLDLLQDEVIILQKQVIDQMKTIRELEFKNSLQTSITTDTVRTDTPH